MFQVIDMHCDTIPALQWKEKQEHLADADLQINLDKLEKGGSLCQCFSLFTFLKGLTVSYTHLTLPTILLV